MPGYVIHIAVANEYLKKHNRKEDKKEFINGVISPDLTIDKTKTHYGKSPAYTNLKKFLKSNSIENSYNRGAFLHLITDYLFYNHYLNKFSKKYIYDDYDILNETIIKRYKIDIPDIVKDKIFFKSGKTKILDLETAYKIINEVSDLDIDNVKNEIYYNSEKWNYYSNIV